MKNPLLTLAHQPQFSAIKPQHIKPAITCLLHRNQEKLKKLLQQKNITWDNFMTPFTLMNEELNSTWSVVKHLHAVIDTKKLRQAYSITLPLITRYFTKLKHHKLLYQTLKKLQNNSVLNKTQHKILADLLLDFRLNGSDLPFTKKRLLLKLNNKLLHLQNKFAQHVLDATNDWQYLATAKEVRGIPQHDLQLAVKRANQAKKSGFLFTLDMPVYYAVITYAHNRTLRKKMYRAYVTRASKLGESKYDNTKIITAILATRRHIAQFLNFPNYAALSLTTKMLKKPHKAHNFLHHLAISALKKGKKEYATLQKFAANLDQIKKLQPWDIAYYSEKLRQQKHKISQEELRAYFPLNHVLHGMFNIAHKLFGITIKEQQTFNRWHKDVRLFKIYAQNQPLGIFYTDLYARKNKQSGAWMDRLHSRIRINKEILLPAAYLTCNFTPPLNNASLLTHDEVITLFHEFGHCLHHLLTRVDYLDASGINGVPYDVVEMPSQLMENWTWEIKSLKLLTHHHKTKKTLPYSWCKKLYASKNFQTNLRTLRQLEFALFDLELHLKFNPHINNQALKILHQVRKKVRCTPTFRHDYMPNSFLHVFADDYAAGYYSYKWAETLAQKVFAQFKKRGIFDHKTGMRFLRTILSTGSSMEPEDLFKAFFNRGTKR